MEDTLTSYYSVSLWYLQGCSATFYIHSQPNEKRKPIQTISFTQKAILAYKQLNSFVISAPTSYFIHLTTILLQNNLLTSLPNELWKLENLKELNLGHNKLTEISPDVGNMKYLQRLYLYNNQLNKLPHQIGLLKELSELDVTSNQLTYLPYGLNYQSLIHFWFEDNLFLQDHSSLASPTSSPISSVFIQSIPSLRDLCHQCIGPNLQKDQMDYLPFSILQEHHPVLYNTCSKCDAKLYFEGISLLHHQVINNVSLPFVYLVCSQTCRSLWLKEHQDNID